MKVVLAFDSFKETMDSLEVANITKEELLKKYPDIDIKIISVADGGEGSLKSIAYSNDSFEEEYNVTGPHFERINASVLNVKGDYYIESASVVGFKFKKNNDSPKNISTYGIGELIRNVLDKEPKSINICLGGTISNDGGCGMLCALGVKFYDKNNNTFIPLGKNLKDIDRIDISELDDRIFKTKVYALSDVTNPLYGANGASYVFARQKGATEEEIELLDKGLMHFNSKVIDAFNVDESKTPGSGAAGGIGFATYAFLKAKQKSGINAILEACNFNAYLDNADYVFTGEGKLDGQSFQGKAIMGIIDKALIKGIKVIGIFGTIEAENVVLPKNVVGIYKTNYLNLPFFEVKKRCKEDLRFTIQNINL